MHECCAGADNALMNTRFALLFCGRRLLLGTLTAWTLLLTPATAAADITAFFGAARKPEIRSAKGLSLGITLIAVGLEVEYSDVSEKPADAAPRLRTGMVNAIVQTPTSGAQLYATIGAGVYRESLGSTQETNTGLNLGGGIKMGLAGPLKLRLDYRLFRLRGEALHPTVHRVYAGINASF